MLEKVKQFVNESFRRKGANVSLKHFERTVYWVKQLKPDADEPILIAAYAHDVARAFASDGMNFWKNKELNDPVFLERHQMESARIIGEFLSKETYSNDELERVRHMVRYHEVGGDNESNLIKDADSISYFEVNALRHVEKFGKALGKKKTKVKFDFMFNRISSDKARKIAEPMYKKAVEMLELS